MRKGPTYCSRCNKQELNHFSTGDKPVCNCTQQELNDFYRKERLNEEISEATQLLRQHGYVVNKKKSRPGFKVNRK